MFNDFYKGKTVLVTGHTGFKGSWLSIWLINLGAKVIGYSLDPEDEKGNYLLSKIQTKIIDIRGDIRDSDKLRDAFNKYEPEIVFHLAAQPLVIDSYKKPKYTYEVNLNGTLNVLEHATNCDNTNICIVITTDKAYKNKEQVWGYRENDELGGFDPYSSSKACAEILVSSWRDSFLSGNNEGKLLLSTVRAGNVIGGGDWSSNRLIPDCIRGIEESMPIKVRNPRATRPWQHVLEPLYGYLLLAYKMSSNKTFVGAWNFGPNLSSIRNVGEIVAKLVFQYGKGEITESFDDNQVHEANLLSLDISKSHFLLNWKPLLTIDDALRYTVEWYKKYTTFDVFDLCSSQIESYTNKVLEDGY